MQEKEFKLYYTNGYCAVAVFGSVKFGRLYLEFLDSRSCSFMEGFLRWILSTPRDLGGGVFGDIGREFVLCPGTARESLPVKKTQNKHNYNLEGDDICRILARVHLSLMKRSSLDHARSLTIKLLTMQKAKAILKERVLCDIQMDLLKY